MKTWTRMSGGVAGVGLAIALMAGPVAAAGPSVIRYDADNMAEYNQLWTNPYGLGEMALDDTRSIVNGKFKVSAAPFQTAADFSVFDHLKYIAISARPFAVPEEGSLEFSVDIKARTPGTREGRVIRGCYGTPGSYLQVGDPCARKWKAEALQGQQAGVVLNMINFETGQLFDWFVSGDTAFALIERLPSTVTGAGNVGLDRAYTQIIKEVRIDAGETHRYSIRFTRNGDGGRVRYQIDGETVAVVRNVGVPLDVQGVDYTGIYPSLGNGEVLADQLDSFVIGHGLFSLLDAFPFQHPDAPELSVSIPVSQRIFGQGAVGTFSDFRVRTIEG